MFGNSCTLVLDPDIEAKLASVDKRCIYKTFEFLYKKTTAHLKAQL